MAICLYLINTNMRYNWMLLAFTSETFLDILGLFWKLSTALCKNTSMKSFAYSVHVCTDSPEPPQDLPFSPTHSTEPGWLPVCWFSTLVLNTTLFFPCFVVTLRFQKKNLFPPKWQFGTWNMSNLWYQKPTWVFLIIALTALGKVSPDLMKHGSLFCSLPSTPWSLLVLLL